ncbi:MAG: hypothetical protein IPM20_10700 [Gammaproteobacteria bacterium]|nr:hypothetical protein [Gammaproteobacteria bacterium]
MLRITAASLAVIGIIHAEPVLACATCLCGDPTITTMGAEKPFAGRLRIGVDALTRGETVGDPGVDGQDIDETRVTYSLSYAPSADWIFAASLPYVHKEVRRFDLSHETASGLGDADLSARWYLRDAAQIPARHLWGLQFGVRVPTSSEQQSNGVPIDIDAQPGGGATIPNLGVWYGYFRTPSFFYLSAAYQHAVDEGYQGYEAGDVMLMTAHAQYALAGNGLALSFSLDARSKEHDHYSGVVDPDSGGVLVMATPGVVWMPLTDLIVNLSYQIPAIENLHGRQEEDPVFRIGVTYDL